MANLVTPTEARRLKQLRGNPSRTAAEETEYRNLVRWVSLASHYRPPVLVGA